MGLVSSLIGAGTNLAIAGATNKLNKDISDKNLDFQKENLEYQKALQQQIFNREDTAYQRKVNDLIAAGLNPALAGSGAGSGAGSIVSTSAPQNNMQYKAPTVNLGSVLDTLSSIEKLKEIKVQIDNAKKQGKYIESLTNKADAETTGITFNNGILNKTQEDKIRSIIYQTDILQKQKEMLYRQAELNRIGYEFSRYGILPETGSNSPFMRELQLKNKMLDLQWNTANQNFKKIKNENDAFWWRFGIDNFNKLASGFADLFKVGAFGGFF